MTTSLKVMVIDDSSASRQRTEAVLRQAGIKSILVSDWTGVSVAIRKRPTIAVVDLQLPTLNGEVITKTIKKFHPKIKVILFSDSDTQELQNAKERCGADSWLPKKELYRLPALIETILNPQQK